MVFEYAEVFLFGFPMVIGVKVRFIIFIVSCGE